MFVLESLISGDLWEFDDWDDAWWFAKYVACHGGNPEGNVYLHETTRYDPSTFNSQFAPGFRQSKEDRRKIVAYLKGKRHEVGSAS